jgi:hypothetical protein
MSEEIGDGPQPDAPEEVWEKPSNGKRRHGRKSGGKATAAERQKRFREAHPTRQREYHRNWMRDKRKRDRVTAQEPVKGRRI